MLMIEIGLTEFTNSNGTSLEALHSKKNEMKLSTFTSKKKCKGSFMF